MLCYPGDKLKLFNTTRIKKYSSCCVVIDELSGESTPVMPVQAVILSLFQGLLTTGEISDAIDNIYNCGKDTTELLINDVVGRCSKYLNMLGAEDIIASPYKLDPMSYLYKAEDSFVDEAFSEPYEAILLVTEKCNLMCEYCFRGGGYNKDELSTENWLKIVDDLEENKIVRCMLSGGEPTLHPGIVSIVESLTKYNIFPYLVTNGVMFDEVMIKKMRDAGLKYTQISLDSVNEGTYKKITGVDALAQVLRNINNAIELGIAIGIKAVVTRYNYFDIIPLIKYCYSLGVKKISFDIYSPSYMGGICDDLLLPQQEYEQLVEIISEQAEKYKDTISVKKFRKIPCWKNEGDIIRCGAFLGSLTINSVGDIVICDQFDDERLRPGNLLNNSIREVWNSKKMSDIRGLKNLKLDPICSNCEHLYKCNTGCFSISKLYSGNPFSPDPRCWKAIVKGPSEVYNNE